MYSESDALFEDDFEAHDGLKFLTFNLGVTTYGFDVAHVMEIVGVLPTTRVPDVPAYVDGVANLRGRIIPIMDMRVRVGMPRRQHDLHTCTVVIRVGDHLLGLVVDKVREVIDVPEASIQPRPRLPGQEENSVVRGLARIGEVVTLLLHAEHVIIGTDDLGTVFQ